MSISEVVTVAQALARRTSAFMSPRFKFSRSSALADGQGCGRKSRCDRSMGGQCFRCSYDGFTMIPTDLMLIGISLAQPVASRLGRKKMVTVL